MFIKTYDINDTNINEFNNNVKQGTAMVAYTADWCGHCKRLKPHWDTFQNNCKGKKTPTPVTVAHCDVPSYQNTAFGAKKVQGFPTIIAFKDGKEISRFSQMDGNRENPKDLERFLKKFMKVSKKKRTRKKTKIKKKKKKKKKTKKKKTKKKRKRRKRRSKKMFKNLVKRLGY
jgi:thioredoxin-like negative regulator of GroEL